METLIHGQLKPVDLLFVGPHPDDVELSAGGTVAALVRAGHTAGMLDLTRGEMGTRGTPASRTREARLSARALGAAFRLQLDCGDGGLRTGREEELAVIAVIRAARPRLVFAPFPVERHPDHERGGRLATEAAFYSGLRRLAPETAPHRPQAVIYYLQNYMQTPSFIVDVTASWKQKMRAIAAYKTQFHDPKSKEPRTVLSDPDFLPMIEARARHFGAMIGSRFGEAFVTIQPPRIDDPLAAYAGREVESSGRGAKR